MTLLSVPFGPPYYGRQPSSGWLPYVPLPLTFVFLSLHPYLFEVTLHPPPRLKNSKCAHILFVAMEENRESWMKVQVVGLYINAVAALLCVSAWCCIADCVKLVLSRGR